MPWTTCCRSLSLQKHEKRGKSDMDDWITYGRFVVGDSFMALICKIYFLLLVHLTIVITKLF